MNRGIARVRPLEGGYDEWKRLGYPLEPAGRLQQLAR